MTSYADKFRVDMQQWYNPSLNNAAQYQANTTNVMSPFAFNNTMNTSSASNNYWNNYWNNGYMYNNPSLSVPDVKVPFKASTAEDTSFGISMTGAEKKECIEQEKKDKEEEHKKEHSLGSSLAFGSLFLIPTGVKAFRGRSNKIANNMFYPLDKTTNLAKYGQLYKDAPIVMTEAQAEFNKASHKYIKEFRKNKNKRLSCARDFDEIKKIMQTALDSGNADEVAKATAKIKAANGVKYKKLAKLGKTKAMLAQGADVSKVVAKKGNSILKHFGGRMGIIGGIGFGLLFALFGIGDIKKAYEHDKETGKQQLKQTLVKSIVPMAGFMVGDAAGKCIASKILGKSATKFATKLASKCAGKAIGAIAGSIVPGLGTVIGLTLGTLADFLVAKYLIPKLFNGENSALENKEIACKSEGDLFMTIVQKKLEGKELTTNENNIINKNKKYYEQVLDQLQAEQQNVSYSA